MRYLILLLALLFPIASQAEEPIKIGWISSYTGLPHFIERGNRAAEMVVEDLNAAGGIDGRPVELIIRDDRASAGDAMTIAEDLISRDGVHVLAGTNFSHIALSLAQLAERYKIPYFASWCAADKCIEAGGDYLFSVEEYASDSGRKLARLVADTKAQKWAVLGNPIEWTLQISGSFKEELQRLRPDIEFVDDLMYGFGKTDGPQAVQALKAKGVEGVFNGVLGKELVSYLRAAEGRQFLDETVNVSAYLAPEEMGFLGELAPKGWYTMGYPEYHLQNPDVQNFIKHYEEKYDGQNPGMTGLFSSLTLNLIFETLRQADSLEPKDIVTAAREIEADTVLGPMSFDPDTQRAYFTYWYGMIDIDDQGKPYLKEMEIPAP